LACSDRVTAQLSEDLHDLDDYARSICTARDVNDCVDGSRYMMLHGHERPVADFVKH
jgi:spore maturation protein CgeB